MSRKIYFAGSIAGGRQDEDLYFKLIKQLQQYGEVLTEVIGIPGCGKREHTYGTNDFKRIHDQDLDWLKQCEYLVAEVTQPSLGVGYEIGRAIHLNKKILCLFRPSSGKRLSAMVKGAENGSSFQVRLYQEHESSPIFEHFFKKQENANGFSAS